MGDPRRLKKQYQTPGHPWQKTRIEEEAKLRREYGLKNKKEIWKMDTQLKGFAGQAKRLIAARGAQAEKEHQQLFARLERLGLLSAGAALDDVLSLKIHNILDRRLQTVLVKNKLARSHKQARQMITHQHVLVDGKVVSSPAYLVTVDEETKLGFRTNSPFSKEDHPERVPPAPTGTVVSPDKDAEESEVKAAEKPAEAKKEEKAPKKTEKKTEDKKEAAEKPAEKK